MKIINTSNNSKIKTQIIREISYLAVKYKKIVYKYFFIDIYLQSIKMKSLRF